jgi:hypothetical protein
MEKTIMANKIKMALQIDEASHPDLYAHIIGINELRNRTERVRHLASLGLLLVSRQIQVVTPGDTSDAPHLSSKAVASDLQVPVTQEISVIPVNSRTVLPAPTPLSTKEAFSESLDASNSLYPSGVSKNTVDTGTTSGKTEPQESAAARAARKMAQAGLFGLPSGPKPD